jgi:hypothetical protein
MKLILEFDRVADPRLQEDPRVQKIVNSLEYDIVLPVVPVAGDAIDITFGNGDSVIVNVLDRYFKIDDRGEVPGISLTIGCEIADFDPCDV